MRESLRTVILGYSGVIHAYFMDKSLEVSRIRALMEQLEVELFSVGGDWRSRHVVTRNSNRDEQAWITQIEQELKHS